MSSHGVTSNDAPGSGGVANVNMKLEVVVIPVSDVDRAKEFYLRLGWRLDADRVAGDNFRLIQFTPPGSGSSIQFGVNLTSAAPGSAQASLLIVSDIIAAHQKLVAQGIDASEIFHCAMGLAAGFLASTSASADHTRRVSVMDPLFHSRIRTATAGCCRKSRSGFLGAFKDTTYSSLPPACTEPKTGTNGAIPKADASNRKDGFR